MDPISQGVLGAVAAGCGSRGENIRLATIVGWAGGMLADADIFIRSETDPLLNIEYHRHFSHSLAFIPIGGLICASLFWIFLRRRLAFSKLYLFATLGYATAGLLDACTSYGTQLLWPFSDERISWSIISIIDPVFTAPLLFLTAFAFFRRKRAFPFTAAAFALTYLSLGYFQNQRALTHLYDLASSRGHTRIERAAVKPSIANLLVWRSIYAHDGQFYVDAIRVGPFSKPTVYPGTSTAVINPATLAEGIPEKSPLLHDIARFAHFSENYLAYSPYDPLVVSDLRYATIPNSIAPLWGIRLDASKPDQHAPFETYRSVSKEDRKTFTQMLLGKPTP